MIKIKKRYKQFINTGVYADNKTEHKRIRLLNAFGLTWFVFLLFFITADIFFSRSFLDNFKVHLFSILVIGCVFFLQKHKKLLFARVLFILVIIFVTFVFAYFYEPSRLMESFYFIYPLVALVLIDKKWITLSIMILCWLLHCIPLITTAELYPEKMMNPIYILAIFIATYVILNYSQSLNRKKEIELNKSKQALEAAYKELELSKKNELAFLELKSLKSQMNPHFIFNSLNSIQDLILQQNTDSSYDYVVLFSQLVRNTLNYSNKNFIAIEKELEFLEIYLQLEKLRFEDDLTYTIQHINTEGLSVPSLIVQPFIENALIHGLLHKSGKKQLTIDFTFTDHLLCTVTDNGIGRKEAKKIQQRQGGYHESFALEAIEQRLEILKEQYGKDVGYQVFDLYDDALAMGTKVEIRMPYKKEY
ncbi:sensor histidine kinase [Aquimarina longa]|uniref:sensor histidine kinase n=1 Tax=Aquimarina longa TaxID=1080221 RepID=UPI0007829630|nr:histidine kinase [Aquimarina longa]